MHRLLCLTIILIALLLPLHEAVGNSRSASYSRVSFFAFLDSWSTDNTVSDEKLKETVFGVAVDQVIGPKLAFNLFGTVTSASHSDPLGSDISFSSMNDVRLKGTYYFADRLAAVSLSANIPTGKVELSSDEYFVAKELSDNSRRFAVRRFGQGFDVGVDAFVFPKHRKTDFAIGIGYVRKGSYTILAGDPLEYKYGGELRGEAGATWRSSPFRLQGKMMLKVYGEDEYGSEAVYKAGKTLILNGQASYSKRVRGRLGFVIVNRGKAKISDSEGSGLSEESVKSGRSEFSAFLTGSLPVGRTVRVIGRGEYKSVSANDFDPSSPRFRPEGNYIGLGGGLSNQFSPTVSASLMAMYYSGSIDSTDDITGIGLAAILNIRY